MDHKLKLWNTYPQWKDAEKAWDSQAEKAALSHPLKQLSNLPQMPGITKETASFLKYKSLRYILLHDENRVFPKYFFKHPIRYTLAFFRSLLQKECYTREGDLFF
ncbi:MAG: hypothetical protein HYZ48_05515 [Chlamydiales bacterium]|nr:hypothetical protein [Chlamydiales bacterium]